jgi:hypothetical protein
MVSTPGNETVKLRGDDLLNYSKSLTLASKLDKNRIFIAQDARERQHWVNILRLVTEKASENIKSTDTATPNTSTQNIHVNKLDEISIKKSTDQTGNNSGYTNILDINSSNNQYKLIRPTILKLILNKSHLL